MGIKLRHWRRTFRVEDIIVNEIDMKNIPRQVRPLTCIPTGAAKSAKEKPSSTGHFLAISARSTHRFLLR